MNGPIAPKPALFPDFEEKREQLHNTGVLPSQSIADLISSGSIVAPNGVPEDQVQPASLDLRLGDTAYRVRASFLPGRDSSVMTKVRSLLMQEIDLRQSAVLERGCVYIVPIAEELRLPNAISAKANPKSTTGRLDVFTRLIVDNGTEFESVPPGYRGRLFVEVVPRTFSVRLGAGTKLNQLRFLRGTPPSSDKVLDQLHEREGLVFTGSEELGHAQIAKGLWISIDLIGAHGNGSVVGYRARSHAPLVDLSCVGCYDPSDFWEPIVARTDKSMILNPGDFYILISKQRIRVPPSYAAEMVPYDPSVGEFRIHYAGFFDPGFGYGNNDIRGTPAVLEVRSHEVPFVLEEGQVIGRLLYERLTELPSKLYGAKIGSSYQGQGLSLSKQFRRTEE